MAKGKIFGIKADKMRVTILLVMSIFGGIIGFYLGRGASAAQIVSLREAAILMKDKGALLEDAGKLLDAQGKRTGDREMIEIAKDALESGSILIDKGTSMMGLTQ
jgi:hypothetical protein